MKQFAIIGLSNFGKRMLEELCDMDVETIIIDKDRETIEEYKDKATNAYIADAINEAIINKLVPPTIDCVIVDLGENREVSILVTHYLKKMGIKEIVVKAETDEHGEILEVIGATRVVFPNKEAAIKITPLLVSDLLFNYIPISAGLVMAEVQIPQQFVGKTLVESNLRQKLGVNVIAIRNGEHDQTYDFFSPTYRLQEGDVCLIVGKEHDIVAFSGALLPVRKKEGKISGILKNLFPKQKK